tara:strand:+ start:459 stop:668 length:210 start_codon:yes stop_codon:yes gene_type:complete
MQTRKHEETADSVANEINGVFGMDYTFPKPIGTKVCESGYDFWFCVFTGNQFEQAHYFDWVKEVSNRYV